MHTLTKDEVSNMKLMTDTYMKSIHDDLENQELDGEMLMKVLDLTCKLTMLNAMSIAEINENEISKWHQKYYNRLNNYKKNARKRTVKQREMKC